MLTRYTAPLGGEGCPARSTSKTARSCASPLQVRAATRRNVSGTARESGTRLTQAVVGVLLSCSAAHAGVVLPDNCSAHPTPPPQVYVDHAIEAQRVGLMIVEVRRIPASEVNAACERASGLSEPVGFPGRRFGACNILYVDRLPVRAIIIIPEAGREGALCHELGHAGGWPWNHPR